MGATGGGVWKTEDAGDTWRNVSDGFFKTGSVGSIAAAPSRPETVYVGMGESALRGNITFGDGVYRTDDGGRTWRNIGLSDTQFIGRVRVHPTDPETAWVAALGPVFSSGRARGIFKTTDGGASWTQTLYVNRETGAQDLSFAPQTPNHQFAGTWTASRRPWELISGGSGSGLWESTDSGDSWTEVSSRPGLPAKPWGKVGVSVSPADPKRVYALIEAHEGGLYRSSDGGGTWELVNSDRNIRQRAWYYTRITADPKDSDTVYINNVSFYRSTDGGKTLRTVRTPHSDNHDLWINPTDPNDMINANDGGANVTKDGGRTWTEQDFPTAQLYHVSTDNAFPYNILAAQQDNSTVRIPSRTFGRGITADDWTSTAGGESGYVAAKPDAPHIVVGGSYGGYLEVFDHLKGIGRDINAWPLNPMGAGAEGLVHRFQWTFPIVFSPHNPSVLYVGSQHVLKSTDLGRSWQKISPDLSYNDKSKQKSSGGPITKDNTSVEYYGVVFTIAPSSRQRGLIWAGTDDGRIHITRNDGRDWLEVTPRNLPRDSTVSLIEASPHHPGRAIAAVNRYRLGDDQPMIFITEDFGQNWRRAESGIMAESFVRVVREDPIRPGLLYAGTEAGVYVSHDRGQHWQPLQLNLPNVPIHDLVVKDGDLIAATHGRSIWVLDDLTPIRNAMAEAPGLELLPAPMPLAVRWGSDPGEDQAAGDNPDSGLIISYHLPKRADNASIVVLDQQGVAVGTGRQLSTEPGFHRTSLSLSYPSYRPIRQMVFWAAGPQPIPAPPGQYRVRLTVDGEVLEKMIRWSADPRLQANDSDLQEQARFARQIAKEVDRANEAVYDIRFMRLEIGKRVEAKAELQSDADQVTAHLRIIENAIHQTEALAGQDLLNFPIRLNNQLAALIGTVLISGGRPTRQSYDVFRILKMGLEMELTKLEAIKAGELSDFSRKCRSLGLEGIATQAPVS
jgi:photosystem II stability/assembly factor-like uncharacterized protein